MKQIRLVILTLTLLSSFGLLTVSLVAARDAAERTHLANQKSALTPEDTGGPDAFGYTYIDSNEPGGPAYSFVEITGTNNVPFADESRHGPFPLGFSFNYYGTDYSAVWMGSNGWLTVGAADPGSQDPSNDCPLPSVNGNANLIAGIWDDLTPTRPSVPPGTGWYQSYAAGACPYGGYAGACFIAEWKDMYHFSSTPADDMTFQILLFDDDRILIQIEDASNEAGSGSTTGIENADGTVGLTYGSCNTAGHISDALAILFEPPSGPLFNNSIKSGPSVVTSGMPITYTLVLNNSGATSSTNTLLTDTIPAGTTYIDNSIFCVGGTGTCSYSPGLDAVTWAGSIDAGESVTVTFAVDTSSVICGTSVTNIAALSAANAPASPYTLQHDTEIWDNILLRQDFEVDDGGFVANTPPGEWAWGDLVPSVNAPPAAHSGTKLWATNLSGNITTQPSVHYLTKTLSLPMISTGQLVWWDWWDEDNSDEGRVLLNGTEVYFVDADQPSWQQHMVDLFPWQGQTVDLVYYYLAQGSSTGGAGWYVDDVAVFTCDPSPMPDLSNSTKTAPDTVVSGSTFTYTVAIINSGAMSAANTIMTDTIPAGTVYVPGSATSGAVYNMGLNQIEWTGDVDAGETIEVSFMVTATIGSGVVTNTAVITQPQIAAPLIVTATTIVEPDLPIIAVAPTSLSTTQASDTQVTQTLTISNIGTGDLDWDIVEEPAQANFGSNDSSILTPGSFNCNAADIPWVSASPTSGTTSGGSASDVTVTFDSIGLGKGVYTGTLCVNSNDVSNPVVTLPLTLTVVAPAPAITLAKTVGTDSSCASTDTITVTIGTEVTYCYTVTNTGNVTLDSHDLEDSELGILLNDFAYDLNPGESVPITETAMITASVTNTATWTASSSTLPDVSAMAMDMAAVVAVEPEPSITLEKTVGTDSSCASTDTITATIGTEVTYCYTVTNTGNVMLDLHDLEDSDLGILLTDFAYDLSPGESVFVTETATVTLSTVNTATWTASNSAQPDVSAMATDTATVVAVEPEPTLLYIFIPFVARDE